MLHDYTHAAALQARYERLHYAPVPRISTELRTLSALACLLRHFIGSDDGISDELWQAADDCVGEQTRADGGCDVRDAIAEARYDDPAAAATYLATRVAPSMPVNRVRS